MNMLVSDFIEYLTSIGILAKDSLGKFQSKNEDFIINDNDILSSFKSIMSSSLFHYIFSFNDEQKKIFIDNIINKFINNSSIKKKSSLRSSVLLVSIHNNQIFKQLISNSFSKWKVFTKLRKLTSSKSSNEYLSKQRTTASLLKRLDYLSSSSLKSIHHSFDCTLSNTFNERQNNFLKRKSYHSRQVSKENEKVLSEICTFHPIINSAKPRCRSSTPRHIRLYNDYIERKAKAQRIQNEVNKEIKRNASRNVFEIDKGKIQQLYNEYKTKQLYKKNLTRLVDKENGITYKPYVPHDEYHRRVKTTFIEREHEYLEERNKLLIEDEKKYKEKRLKELVGYENWKGRTNEVCRSVIGRLYGENAKSSNKLIRYKYNNVPYSNTVSNVKQDISFNTSNNMSTNTHMNTKTNIKNHYSFTTDGKTLTISAIGLYNRTIQNEL